MTAKGDELLWVNFEDIGHAQARCKLCQKTYSFKTSVANLWAHLQRNHESSLSSTAPAETTTPHRLFVTSTTLTTDKVLSYSSALEALSEHSDTDTQNYSQTAESSDVEKCPKKVAIVFDEISSAPRTRAIRRRMKRPSLRGATLHIDTAEDFGRLISKKMHMLPLAIRCGLEVDILRMVNGALNAMDSL